LTFVAEKQKNLKVVRKGDFVPVRKFLPIENYCATFLFKARAKNVDVKDITAAVRKIRLYASGVGKLPEIP